MTPTTILVTGGAGYVGSHTAAVLLKAGHDVVIFDNLRTGNRRAAPSGAQLIEGDLLDRAAVERVCGLRRFDAVIHFAANSLVGESMVDPFRYLGDNVTAAANLLRAACAHGVDRIVFSSTANLFSAIDDAPIGEAAPIVPGSPYGESKYFIERMLHWTEQVHGMRSAILRYFNAAGADPGGERGEDHDPETHLIPIVLQCVLRQRRHVEIFGDDYPTPDGTCLRDYIHVNDLANAHLLALDALASGSVTYNLGTGRGHSVREVIDSARRVTGVDIPVIVGPRRPGDSACLVASPSLIRRELGWVAQWSDLDAIVFSAWQWHRSHPNGFGSA